MKHSWLVYLFMPSEFRCLRCGASSGVTLPAMVAEFVALFRAWAEPHFDCTEVER